VADALAWALHANGRDIDALRYADQALHLGTRSAQMYYHRGMIRAALGQSAGARADLTEALRINPYFSVRHVPIAKATLVRLGGGK
jgi:regulator of sirC expression with transglutaminase-like and TPR domain